VGDAFSAIHHPTSMLVSRYTTPAWDNDFILIDCPQSIRKMMRDADNGQFHGLDLHRINTLILTHLHTDHASGLETLAAFFKIVVGRKLRLMALPEVLEGVPRFLEALKSLGSMEDLFDVVELHPDAPLQIEIDGSTVSVESRVTSHPIPTAGLRITVGARTFAYSCDTTFDQGLWKWLWKDGPGLVVHEVGHGIHTSYDDIMANMGSAHAALRQHLMNTGNPPQLVDARERLRLIHYPDDLLPLLEATNLNAPNIKVMREGWLEIV
jgi:ribonuclease BN (tRNA processing enzyme)